MPLQIQEATDAHISAIAGIYNHYIRETVVSFEETPLSEEQMGARVQKVRAASLPWLVALEEEDVVGYGYAGPWHERAAYRHSVETSVYLHPHACGRGIGSRFYEELLPRLKDLGLHTAIAGVALPNDASVRLHEKFGFVKAAHYRQVGFKFGEWIDVGYFQLIW